MSVQRRASSLSNGRRRRQTDQRKGEDGDEAMHLIDEWMSDQDICLETTNDP
jgi:hypothetical protein